MSQDTSRKHPTEQETSPDPLALHRKTIKALLKQENLELGNLPLYLTPGEAEQLKLLVKIHQTLETMLKLLEATFQFQNQTQTEILQVMERPSLEMANKLHTLSMFKKEDEPDES